MPTALTSQSLKDLAHLRIAEAEALLNAGHYDGACYLCGYVIELGLKAVICKTLRLADYPPVKLSGMFKTHSIDELLVLSGLQAAFRTELSQNVAFAEKWSTVTRYGPDQRYNLGSSKNDAEQAIDAIKSAPDGVLPWLLRQW